MDNELVSACKKVETVYIYGAGTVADFVFLFLKQNQIEEKVESFVVTKLGGNVSTKFGREIGELSERIEELQKNLVIVAVQQFIQEEIVNILRENQIHDYFCIDPEELLNDFYRELYREPIKGNKILFQNQSGVGYGGNPKYIAEKLLEMDEDKRLDLVWAVSQYKESFPRRIRQVLYGSEEYYKELSTARVWIDNSRKGYSIRKREGQFYVQAWHGAAPIKRVEADVCDKLPAFYIEGAKNDSKMADVFLSGSAFYSELYRKSFWYEGKILKFGLPRHDVFWRAKESRRKIHDFYHIDKDVSIVLYAPTFRDYNNVPCYDLDINRAVCALEKKFHKRFQMMVSRHPVNYQEYSFDEKSEFLSVGDYDDFQELLAAADVLITDYSGCMYDFSYTKRPIFLYQKDYREYMQDRDFYIPMDKLPYGKAHSNDELEKAIETFDMDTYVREVNAFMDSMGNYDTGDASEKVARYLRENVIEF